MGLFGKKPEKDVLDDDRSISSLSSSDRKKHIEELESARSEVIYQIEDLMAQISKETGNRSLARRKKKLGKSPNDWSAE